MDSSRVYRSRFLFVLLVMATISWIAPRSWGYDGNWPLIFDWTVSVEWANDASGLATHTLPSGFHANISDITPLPKPSYYGMPKEDPKYAALFTELRAQQRPMGFMTGNDTSPLYGPKDSGTLAYTLNHFDVNGYKLDYVFVEYEPQFAANMIEETHATTDMIRSHANPLINQARIGEYDINRTTSMPWMPYPGQGTPERIAQTNALYDDSGLDVAMPSLYPYESYASHADANRWRTTHYNSWDIFKQFPFYTYENVSPNKRSALFWGPLVKLSDAKLSLPAGHWLIPYLSDFVPDAPTLFDAPQPPHEDNAALAQHIRLRGADGYLIWRTASENEALPYPNEQFKADVYAAWSALDWLFEDAGETPVIMNLATNKSGGIEWSGVATENGVAILVSNLGNSSTTFTIPAIAGHPEYDALLPDSIIVAAGAHQLVFAQVPEPASSLILVSSGLFLIRRKTRHGMCS
jgi:hypothetical protein